MRRGGSPPGSPQTLPLFFLLLLFGTESGSGERSGFRWLFFVGSRPLRGGPTMGQCAPMPAPSGSTHSKNPGEPDDSAKEPACTPGAAALLALDVPLLTMDADGIVVHVNDAGIDFFGCADEEQLVGRRLQDLVLPHGGLETGAGSSSSSHSYCGDFASSNNFRAFPPSHTPYSSWYSFPRISSGAGGGFDSGRKGGGGQQSDSLRERPSDLRERASGGSMKAYLPRPGSGSPWVGGSARIQGGAGTEVVPVLMVVTATLRGFTAVLQDLGSTHTARQDAVATDRIEQARDDRRRFIACVSAAVAHVHHSRHLLSDCMFLRCAMLSGAIVRSFGRSACRSVCWRASPLACVPTILSDRPSLFTLFAKMLPAHACTIPLVRIFLWFSAQS